MEKTESEKTIAPILSYDVLVCIFKYLNKSSKGKAAQVCTSWKAAVNCKSLWRKGIFLRSECLNIQSERSILKKGIRRFNVCSFDPTVSGFLRRVPDLETLRFVGCCVKQNVREYFDSTPNSAALSKLVDEGKDLEESRQVIQRYILKAFYKYHQANPSRCSSINDHILKTITTEMKQLKVLYLEGCRLAFSWSSTDSDVEIDFFGREDTMKEDRSMPLQKLCIKNMPFCQRTFSYICQKFVNLIYLNVGFCICSNIEFVHLTKLKKLEFLCVSFIDNAKLRFISQLSNLKCLEFCCHPYVSDWELVLISRLTNLVNLKILFAKANDEAFKHLTKLPLLRELGLSWSEISDKGIFYLTEGNLKLTKLDIAHCLNVSDEGLFNICQSTFILHALDVSDCNVTDDGVSRIIDTFPHLHTLNLNECSGVTDTCRKLVIEKLIQNKNLNLDNKDYDSIIFIDRLNSRLETLLDSIIM